MKKTALLLTLSMSAALGCEKPDDGGGSEEEARAALPAAENLKINLPAGDSAKPALGQVSGYYLITLGTAVSLNGSVGLFLGLVRLIVAFPVTSIDGDTYIWGPWHDQAKPGEYRLTVRYTGGGDYAWSLEGRVFGDRGAFKAVVAGVATPGKPRRGSGSFSMDFDLARTIDPGEDGEGQISVTYDLESTPVTLQVDSEKKVNGEVNTFHYEYAENADQSGDLSFMAFADTDDPGPSSETLQFRSRWKKGGAGRADAQITGGDLGNTTVSATECWNEWPLFRRVYYTDSVSWIPAEGLASSCAF